MEKFIAKITAWLNEFDFAKILPELGPIMDKLAGWLRLALFVGPILLLVLGLWYFFVPPKEANRLMGFQSFFGMGSDKAWRATQYISGAVWCIMGLVFLILMVSVSKTIQNLAFMDLAVAVIKQLLIQAIVVFVLYVLLQFIIGLYFTFSGKLRFKKNM